MKTIVIDNTRKAGNFFDNINNYNFIVKEYDISDNNELKNEDNTSSLKYSYINNDTLKDFINDKYEKIFNERNNNLFKMSSTEYANYKEFSLKHKDCRVDSKTGRNKLGAIGGGIDIEYKINYNYEEQLPFMSVNTVECLICNEKGNLESSKSKNYFDYDEYIKHYVPKFDKVEFYRFMEIYNEFKKPLIIKIMETGLGTMFTIEVDDFIFDITNIDNW